MLETVEKRIAELLADTGKEVTDLQVTVEHGVEKPDFKGDMYVAQAKLDGEATPLAKWTVGDNFKDDPDMVEPLARNLVDRMLEDYGVEEE
ncbi:hypothetical protein [Flavonifractor plautii]|uniref:hypothetical protein n=1 Tax=Bacillati TaxID=1783272 RepID=UPI003D7E6AC2